jgi:Transglycosylase SLT domain
MTGRAEPWPWTTNHAGEGHYFASAQEAIAWVAMQQAAGSRSIDVGCFQVNLQYHPDAFGSLAEAFDPVANARYAADLLNRLYEQSGTWPAAIALYHSADPYEGQRYSSQVMEAWHTGGRVISTPLVAAARSADPVVVRISALASGIRVVVPSWARALPMASHAEQPAGLPRVFTPSR